MLKDFIEHWKHNMSLGARRSWAWMGIEGKLVDILIALLVGVVLGQANILFIVLITIVVAFALYAILALFWAVFIVSFQESKRQEKEISDLETSDWNDAIDISPDVRSIQGGGKMFYGLVVINKGHDDLLDCFADLERTVWAGKNNQNMWMHGSNTGFRGRLSWLESVTQSRDCKRNIETGNAGTPVLIADLDNKFEEITVRLCEPEHILKKQSPGELRCLVRVGGSAKGRSVKPIFVMIRITLMPQHNEVKLTATGITKLKNREEFDQLDERWNSIYDEQNKGKIERIDESKKTNQEAKRKNGSPNKRVLRKGTKKGS